MIDLDSLYFEWLLTRLDPDGVSDQVAYVCSLLHKCPFERRVGLDVNRAKDGSNLRIEFFSRHENVRFDQHDVDELLMLECSWLEMLVALSERLDFLYDGGVEYRFVELMSNLGLEHMLRFHPHRTEQDEMDDQYKIDTVTSIVNHNEIDRDGHGGLFPLYLDDHPDQRDVEIWDQHAAYFRERLEGVLWTSTN